MEKEPYTEHSHSARISAFVLIPDRVGMGALNSGEPRLSRCELTYITYVWRDLFLYHL